MTQLMYVSPEFKRLAAIQGDLKFQAPRRFMLEHVSKTQTAYAFRNVPSLLICGLLIIIVIYIYSVQTRKSYSFSWIIPWF
jgi:hypothetical protein